MPLITDPDQLNQGTEVTIAEGPRTITLNVAGNLSNDGVTMQALYSFLKEEWKDDATLIPIDFPMVAITPEQFELVEGWTFNNDTSRKLVRTGGWSEIDSSNVLQDQFLGVITLGNFEDNTNDTAYYQFGTDQSVNDTVDFDFAGPVNEPIRTYDSIGNPDTCTFAATNTITRATGSFITDGFKVGGAVTVENANTPGNNGTYVLTGVAATTLTVTGTPFTNEADAQARIAVDNRQAITLKVRVRDGDANGKLYGSVNLADIGITGSTTNKVERFPLSSATDLKISETDANIDANSPYTQIELKYFDGTFSRDVDGTTNRSFGAVVDVGTHSGIDASFTASGTVLTSTDGGIPTDTTYNNGTLTILSGTDEGETHTIASTTATTVTITGSTFTSTDSAVSFQLQRQTPVVATAEEIYEKVQRQLRQTTNINGISGATQDVIGRTADDVLLFIGDTLRTLRVTNPANSDAQNGVFISGFDSNDTNRLEFTDNSGTTYTFPFVAAGTISFNQNLQDDGGPAKYWMFYTYTDRTNVTDFVIATGPDRFTSAGSNLPVVAASDYIVVSGLTGADAAMNGVYQASGTPTAASIDVSRWDGATIVAVSATTADIDENAVDTPDAIIVDNNSGADVTGTISGASVAFDYDYDNNVQGGRTSGTDAAVTLIGIGTDTAQHVTSTGTISRATGLAFSLVAGLERNYDNP